MKLHQLVQNVTGTFLEAADMEVPGLIEGLYLTGSVALGDFQSGASDVDFVAVTRAGLDHAGIGGLERVHAGVSRCYRRPLFEGVYVTWDELAHDPCFAVPGPHFHDGRLQLNGKGPRHPVTWHELAEHGLTLRGPLPSEFPIWTNRERLALWVRGNLDDYWRHWYEQSSRILSKRGLLSFSAWSVAWGVLGVSRLHYTLATGEIISKQGAGLYALEAFPKRRPFIVEECLRIRRGAPGPSLYRTPIARRSDSLAFMAMVMENSI
jgi:hypothetical protein